MRFIPIVPKPDRHGQAQPEEGIAGPLPAFYMNDYSVMGLRVSDCMTAFKLLKDSRYTIIHRQGGRGVAVSAAAEIPQIVDLLARNGLSAEVADIAEQIYQG